MCKTLRSKKPNHYKQIIALIIYKSFKYWNIDSWYKLKYKHAFKFANVWVNLVPINTKWAMSYEGKAILWNDNTIEMYEYKVIVIWHLLL